MTVPYFNMTFNFGSVCRLCMQEKPSLLSLFCETEAPEQVTPLRCKIMSLAPSVKVYADDGLPTHVCRQCVNQVNMSYNFKKQCEISDATFREYLKNHKADGSTSEQRQNESQNSISPSEDNGENWPFSNVKAELGESDENNDAAMDHEFPAAVCSLAEQGQDSSSNAQRGVPHGQHSDFIGHIMTDNTYILSRTVSESMKSDRELSSGDDSLGSNYSTKMKSSTIKKKFACLECGKNFIQKQHLISHMRTHTGERPFQCKECGKNFAQNVHLKNHQIIHTRLKPFSCSECGKCFAQNIHLKNHLSTHTGEKPYGCNICGKTFSQNVHLKNHLSIHTGEKPFRCTECGKTFAQNIHLKNHLSTHTREKPYGCTECGKTFAQNIHLKNHLATHTGEKPHGCVECGKHFARSGQLKEHTKLHLGVKPFTCVECGKNFTQNVHLKNHLATHAVEKKQKGENRAKEDYDDEEEDDVDEEEITRPSAPRTE